MTDDIHSSFFMLITLRSTQHGEGIHDVSSGECGVTGKSAFFAFFLLLRLYNQ
jgi:hypothetical protein